MMPFISVYAGEQSPKIFVRQLEGVDMATPSVDSFRGEKLPVVGRGENGSLHFAPDAKPERLYLVWSVGGSLRTRTPCGLLLWGAVERDMNPIVHTFTSHVHFIQFTSVLRLEASTADSLGTKDLASNHFAAPWGAWAKHPLGTIAKAAYEILASQGRRPC